MTGSDLVRAVLAAAAGTFVGWTGSALTLGGRVDAIERTLERQLSRIEARMDELVIQTTAPRVPHAKPDPKAR